MTVNTTNITSGPYIGNGASDTYSYTFRVADKTQLSVYETTDAGVQTLLVVDTDYTVNDVGVDAGGTIVRLAGNLPTDYQWYIRSNYIENQLTAFASQGGFFPDVHEAQMDHITFLIQQLRDTTTRSFALSDTIDIDGDFTISDIAADRINKILGFSSTGDLTTVTLNEDFITVYLGAKTSDPTLDNQGNALIDGALYYNTTANTVKVYDLGTTTWGTVNPSNAAIDISVTDTAGYFTGTDVEAVLAEIWVWFTGLWTKLASTVNGEGASMVGVEDAAANFTATDVEGVLAELQTELDTKAPSHRGALTLLGNPYVVNSTSYVALIFNNVDTYDTDSIHDLVTNPSRLTVPTGVTKVKLHGQVAIDNVATPTWAAAVITQNGSSNTSGLPQVLSVGDIGAAGAGMPIWAASLSSAVVEVIAGDYFELEVAFSTSINLDINQNWFAMEIIE